MDNMDLTMDGQNIVEKQKKTDFISTILLTNSYIADRLKAMTVDDLKGEIEWFEKTDLPFSSDMKLLFENELNSRIIDTQGLHKAHTES